MDTSPNVIYLARPYQYFTTSNSTKEHVKYWTTHRFSQEIIEAYEEAVDNISDMTGSEDIHLVGYSGGGAVAAILASKRKVGSLRTIAGYLDHVALNKEKNYSPLFGSLDPILFAPKLHSIPQTHYVGLSDTVIPEWVVERFVSSVGNKEKAKLYRVDASHESGWVQFWKFNH